MTDKIPYISIVIPVKNGMDTLPMTMEGIQLQTQFSWCEVVVIDSGSTDGSIEFLSKFKEVRIISIEPSTFNHGDTRNLGVSHCNGEFIFMTVQDAWTTDPNLLERMLSHFDDHEVMGVCGQQVVPHQDGMNPHEYFRPLTESGFKTLQFSAGEFDKLSPNEQLKCSGWDDVIAMYRKKALQKLPFERTDFAEDLIWAKNALKLGHKIVYDQRNKVCHYHHSFPVYVYKRTFISLYSIYKTFGIVNDLSVPWSTHYKIIYRNFKWKAAPRWIAFNIKAKRAKNKSYIDFKNAVHQGDSFLDQMYSKVCGQIPQGKSYKN